MVGYVCQISLNLRKIIFNRKILKDKMSAISWNYLVVQENCFVQLTVVKFPKIKSGKCLPDSVYLGRGSLHQRRISHLVCLTKLAAVLSHTSVRKKYVLNNLLLPRTKDKSFENVFLYLPFVCNSIVLLNIFVSKPVLFIKPETLPRFNSHMNTPTRKTSIFYWIKKIYIKRKSIKRAVVSSCLTSYPC